jgi:transitional endoplasmic reticulum ATPase
MNAPHDHAATPHAPGVTLDAILATASDETRATLRVLGELLGNEPSSNLSATQFAARHLGVDPANLASTRYVGPTTSLAVLGHLLRLEIDRHAGRVVIGSPGEGEPPTWSQLDLGPGVQLPVPGRLIVFFPAGTLAEPPLCISIDDRQWERDFAILSTAGAKGVAEGLLSTFRAKMKSELNPLRGRVLEARVDDGAMRIGVAAQLAADRSGLILPDPLWAEIDVFLAAATSRRELLRTLGLGTNRGMLVAGPPGVGKTHLVRVIAAELAGVFTTILADANSMRHAIADLYAESGNFGPTLVVLDDIDLVLGHRDGSGHNNSLADFLSALDGVRQRQDILTIATTNDPESLDPAAQRSSRFDTVITLPMPDADLRARILEGHLAALGLAIDYPALADALEGASGADVKEVVRRAVLEHGESFSQDQLLEIAESGRWQTAIDRGRYLAPATPRRKSRSVGFGG